MKKQKLELRKKTISILSEKDLVAINGGVADEQITTSFGKCTGALCCDDTLSIKIALTTLVLTTVIAYR